MDSLETLGQAIDALAGSKASRREVDLLEIRQTNMGAEQQRCDGRVTQLANRIEQLYHTKLPIDPRSLEPVLLPLVERLERLEERICCADVHDMKLDCDCQIVTPSG